MAESTTEPVLKKRYEDQIVVKDSHVEVGRKNFAFIRLLALMHLRQHQKVTLIAKGRVVNNCSLVAKLLENEKCLKITKLTSQCDRIKEQAGFYKTPVLKIQVQRGERAGEELAKMLEERAQHTKKEQKETKQKQEKQKE